MKRFTLLLTVLLLALTAQLTTAAPIALPASDWYAVAWIQDTDTLHWINENGEQASIPRPKLEGQASLQGTRLHIAPNGRYLVVISPLLNGREGIGFFDLQTGQLLQKHETEANEIFLQNGHAPSTINSTHFAATLRNVTTNTWRIILFELTTGNAVSVLNHDSPALPAQVPQDTSWYPIVMLAHADLYNPVIEVHFQMRTLNGVQPVYPTFSWRVNLDPNIVEPIFVSMFQSYSLSAGFDVNRQTGEVVYAWFDPQFGAPSSPAATTSLSKQAPPNAAPAVLVSDPNSPPTLPRWLHNGEWIGYYTQSDVYPTHPVILAADGTGSVPLGPNISTFYHTPDGYLALDSTAWQLYHVTTLAVEAFSSTFDSTVFQPNGLSFGVIYTTPMGTNFSLPAVEPYVLPGNNGVIDGEIAAAPTNTPTVPPPGHVADAGCGAAPAPRMVIGGQGMVSINNSGALNLRDAPNSNIISQVNEGNVFFVNAGPQCANGYLWWNVQVADDLSGWVAEGEPARYYIEMVGGGGVQQPDLPLAQPVNPTATPLVLVAQPVNPPTATPMVFAAVPSNCSQAPATRLIVGMQARTVTDGRLAMRTNVTDEFPTHQIPHNVLVSIIDGPTCHNGYRHWKVNATVNNQIFTGWLSEGTQQRYFLDPQH